MISTFRILKNQFFTARVSLQPLDSLIAVSSRSSVSVALSKVELSPLIADLGTIKLELNTRGEVPERTFGILTDFLADASVVTLDNARERIIALLPEREPCSTEVWSFGITCIDLAEGIPYGHPAQLKLAALLVHLTGTATFGHHQRLREALRDNIDGQDLARPFAHANFTAFLAKLAARGFTDGLNWAVWDLSAALETPPADDVSIEGPAAALAAAQWILWYGGPLFQHVAAGPGDAGRSSEPGYQAESGISLARWHRWRDAFRALAAAGAAAEHGPGEGAAGVQNGPKDNGTAVEDPTLAEELQERLELECWSVSAQAASMMDNLEKTGNG